MGQLRHRGWLVEQNYLGTFEATHPDFDPTPVHLYDGPSDNRAVFAETLEELADEIDAWIEEHEAASERAADAERAEIELRTGYREEDFA